MNFWSWKTLSSLLLSGASGRRLLVISVLSFSFSITVILATIGLMDGFETLLKTGLRKSSGDVMVTHRQGTWEWDETEKARFSQSSVFASAPLIQLQGFLVREQNSKGVIIWGVDKSFVNVTGLDLALSEKEIAIGESLAKEWRLKVGDEIGLMLGTNLKQDLPMMLNLKIAQIVYHGIYEKDQRLVYLPKSFLENMLGWEGKINLMVLAVIPPSETLSSLSVIEQKVQGLKVDLGKDYLVRPFWYEFSSLLEAVQVEKNSITLIVQLIVIVAIFNIVAFVYYVIEKQGKEIFLLRTLGMSLNNLAKIWFQLLVWVWFFSCILSFFLTKIFNWSLQNISWLKVPGDIYILSELHVILEAKDYFLVFMIAFLWVILAAGIVYRRIKKQGMIQALREEFQ